MSSRGKRKNAPKKFVDKPGIPDDVESEESVNENSFSEDNEEYIYESNEENFLTSSEDEEESFPKKNSKTTSKIHELKSGGRKKSTTVSENGYRNFKILVESIIPEKDTPEPKEKFLESNGGKFIGKNPMQAAKKAFNRICRSADYKSSGEDKESKCDYKGSCIYIYKIQETTPNSAQKVFTYRGERLRLEEPQKVPRGNIQYFVYYSSKVKTYRPHLEENPQRVNTKPKSKTTQTPLTTVKELSKKSAPRGRRSQQKDKAYK